MIAKIIFTLLVISFAKAQNSSYGFGIESFPGAECFRACKTATPRVCYFKWHLEHYTAMGLACGTCGKPGGVSKDCFTEQCVTGDGMERGVMSINRQIPGPPIHVCKGDLIVVDVINKMGGTSASIHWHGFHQRKTPHYDGVPFVTQCPIDYGTTFRYSFWATEPGTQFYHSHSGHHKVNGQYGGIVVRQNPKDDTNSKMYDIDSIEHLMVISDWLDNLAEAFDPGLPSHPSGQVPRSLLINGKGTVHNRTTGTSSTGVPLALFRVARDKRYRFRLVNSLSLNCPAELSIEGHTLQVIASDSYSLQPVEVTSIVSLPGERYDFVVTSNQPGDTYWIRIKALGACITRQVQQFAILSYKPSTESKIKLSYPLRTFPAYNDTLNTAVKSLNDPNTKCGPADLNNFCITDLSSFAYAPEVTDVEIVDHQFFLGFDMINQNLSEIFAPATYTHFNNPIVKFAQVAVINKISFAIPSFSPLTQTADIRADTFCNSSSLPESCKGKEICHCTHLLKVKLNSIVELIIVDERPAPSPLNHPFHLHGFPLFVMGMGQDPEKPATVAGVRELAKQGRLNRAIGKIFPVKDTISIPSKGYTIFRFKADNPGFWLLHCHLEFHMSNGMGLILQVGEHDEMVKPPAGFPKCNNFQPFIDQSIFNS